MEHVRVGTTAAGSTLDVLLLLLLLLLLGIGLSLSRDSFTVDVSE